MEARDWIDAFAASLGVEPPDEATVQRLLGLAATAAHASQRTAAPIACYLVGLVGVDPERAAAIAAGLAPSPERT